MNSEHTHKPSNGVPPQNLRSHDEDEISLLDILVVFARKRGLILLCIVACTAVGFGIALTADSEFTSEVTVIRELDDGGATPNLGSLPGLRGLGINIGGGASGLTPEAFPDILRSRAVGLAVVRDTFFVRKLGRSMTFVEYANRDGGWSSTIRRYTIRLPWTVMRALRRSGSSGTAEVELPADTQVLTPEEERAVRAVRGTLSTSVNRSNGLMTISVTTHDPMLSAGLAESFVNHLADRVRTVRTQKARRNLDFIEERFADAQEDLREAEAELAAFLDRNRSIATARLENERDRLRRQVAFSEQLYSEIQTQITQAQIELQRSEPVITVLEEPLPPLRASGPGRSLIMLISMVLGSFLGVVAAFVITAIESSDGDEEERTKLEEIRQAFNPKTLFVRSSSSDRSKAPLQEDALK